MVEQTFYNGCHVIWSISITGKVFFDLDSPLQLPAKQVTFVQEQNELSFSEELGRAY